MTKARHALIAGTGRTGTSFLVKFLDECGLDTGAGQSAWHARARAGLEHRLDADGALPYVVKDPWLFSYCEQIDLRFLTIDALILPMRDLMSAAQSRVHQERMALTEASQRDGSKVQVVGSTPGGVAYSLDVVDQARILGVGFHRLLNWAVGNQLPIFLLGYPRMVQDADYLLQVLWPWLGEHCNMEVARRAFARVASPDAVRIQDVQNPPPAFEARVLAPGEPDRALLDRAALAERIEELKAAYDDQEEIAARQDSRAVAAEQQRDQAERQRDQLRAELDVREGELARVEEELRRTAGSLTSVEVELDQVRRTRVWRARERIAGHRWLSGPARRIVRVLAR